MVIDNYRIENNISKNSKFRQKTYKEILCYDDVSLIIYYFIIKFKELR
jgi:hypothetical protein